MSKNIDTNVNNYTVNELLAILGLDNINNDEIIEKTDYFINKFTEENNKSFVIFFQDIRNKLLGYVSGPTDEEEQVDEWYQNEHLQQVDTNQSKKITDRKNKIDIFEKGEHNIMNRQQLGITNNVTIPVAQDSLNPNLKNTTERFINLDSQFRQTGMSSTNYTLDLSDKLGKTLSMRLFSFQLPVTWYAIDTAYNNTCLWVINMQSYVPISIEPGNYNSTTFVSVLNNAFINSGFTNSSIPNWAGPVSYNSNNAKITIQLYGATYVNPTNPADTFIVSNTTTNLVFFDYTSTLQCPGINCGQTTYINQTLGWVMGFRLPYALINETGNTATAILDLNGPKYFMIVIDDYNQNHVNNGLVSITETSKTLKLPSYYSHDLTYTCQDPSNIPATIQNINNLNTITDSNQGISIMEKLNITYSSYQQIGPNMPRTLTQSQIYTINEIIKNNDKTTNYRTKAPTTPDIFAIIPIKGSQTLGSLYVDYSGSLQDFKRVYFGPVDIERMRISLLDDKGNIVNLNGGEWSITLICETLYQY